MIFSMFVFQAERLECQWGVKKQRKGLTTDLDPANMAGDASSLQKYTRNKE